jgi:type VI secretion system protein ImpC
MQALRELPEGTHLALLAPRFLLRHPYGKRSDPISAFAFEEFTASDGLRGMLWGHPALLAACLLGAPKGPGALTIGELPFHYMTDADGDQIPLPCTERLVTLEVSRRMAGFGLRALLAHKGQPEVRVAGLETMGGTVLALAGVGKPTARLTVTTNLTSKLPEPKEEEAAAAGGDEGEAVTEDSMGSDDLGADSGSSGGDSSDSSLDDLLASLGGDDAAPASDSTATDEPAAEGGGEDAMDPELAELLKSLE